MATILCDSPDRLTIALFGQALRFVAAGGAVECVARLRPFKDVTEDPAAWSSVVDQALAWFASASPRPQADFSPVFGQHIRMSEGPQGSLQCRAVHDGVPRATEDPDELLAVLTRAREWLDAAGAP